MRLNHLGALWALVMTFSVTWSAASGAPTDPVPKGASSESTPTPPPKPSAANREELEKRFEKSMNGAMLKGTWQMTTDGLTGKGPLTEPKPDGYTIVKATKMREDFWVISARIDYGDKNLVIPVPVRVVWAEDTPIITVNDVPIPGIGTYSARVMVFADFYCGTWYSTEKNYGGVMSGRVSREDSAVEKPVSEKKE